ncbi:MAG: NADH-quinone oxidoreductase subunit K [Sedimentisphaerales bacterium]|jgi:multisubunit Na+/H+ antiporter MnhC subunit
MTEEIPQVFGLFSIGAILLLITGFYCLIMTYNLVRALIGLEILTKSVTLFIILAGYVSGRMALAQALAITLIVIEVVVIAVAVGIVLCVYKNIKSIDGRLLRNIKG